MGKIKLMFKRNIVTRKVYSILKDKNDANKYESHFRYHGSFVDRSKGSSKLLIVLAGYKDFLYKDVFERIKRFTPEDIDVCIVTSGKTSDTLKEMCNDHCWSYLSTTENDVGLVQNIAIKLHPNADYIFKLDEDIFITEHYFEKLFYAFEKASQTRYIPGVVAPLLLVNAFCTPLIIEELNKSKEFINRFGKIISTTGKNSAIENNPQVASYMWGETGSIPHIDDLNRIFEEKKQAILPCPIRFSIGAILFRRSLWEEMGYFDVKHDDLIMMGKDEEKMCGFCLINSKPIMITEDTVVGHFSFGAQTEGMKQFYNEHPERFRIQD